MSTIDAIRARLAEITPGQWRALISQEFDGDWIVTTDDMAADLDSVCVVGAPGSPRVDNDAEFIAHAPDDIRHLLAALDAAQARADALADMLERVCVEFEGTHEHLQDIIDGNVTGVLAPIENYKRLKHDLAEMRQMDERAIAAARELMGGDV